MVCEKAPLMPPVVPGIVHLYVVNAGMVPSVPCVGVKLKLVPLQIVALNAAQTGDVFPGTLAFGNYN